MEATGARQAQRDGAERAPHPSSPFWEVESLLRHHARRPLSVVIGGKEHKSRSGTQRRLGAKESRSMGHSAWPSASVRCRRRRALRSGDPAGDGRRRADDGLPPASALSIVVALALSPGDWPTRSGLLIASAVVLVVAIAVWWRTGRPGLPFAGRLDRRGSRSATRPSVCSPSGSRRRSLIGRALDRDGAERLRQPLDHLARPAFWAQGHAVGYVATQTTRGSTSSLPAPRSPPRGRWCSRGASGPRACSSSWG